MCRGSGLRGAEFSHSSPHKTVKPQRGKTPGGKGGRTDGHHRAVDNVPSISIQPDTNLELTEEMVHGQAEVMSRDTPHAKAYGSDSIKAEVKGHIYINIQYILTLSAFGGCLF